MLFVKWNIIGWTGILLLSFSWYAWQCELIDREHPSPVEWSYYTRTPFRAGYARMNPDFDGTGITDWARVGTEFRHCLERLEDPNLDGKGLTDVEDGETGGVTMIEGIDRLGYDVSAKSYPWRDGYFNVLMGCAQAAEFLDDMVRDKTRKIVFPKDMMIGPSNPDPRPVFPGMASAPLEENCDRPYAPPEKFYMRVLTGKGFSTRHKLDAALAYANWLEFKNAHSTAEDVYRWAIDIAASSVSNPELAVDHSTGVLSDVGASSATPNLLRASTAMATHFARTGNVSSALPVFLSVLRARRAAPIDPTPAALQKYNGPQGSDTDYGTVYNLFRSIIRSSAYPTQGPSGDEPLLRSPFLETDCADAEVMLYIGEILFATASTKLDDGLGWTKQAVEVAQQGVSSVHLTNTEKKQCKACLEMGVNNWSTMVKKLVKEEHRLKDREGNAGAVASGVGWRGWFGGGGSKKEDEQGGKSRWEKEADFVEALREKLIREGITEQMAANQGVPGSVWIG